MIKMSNKVDLGGNRLGSGGKNEVELKTYSRSTHDLSYLWRSTMSAGTLVPFLTEVALPGDSFSINLDCDVMTHPTIGPLFGSYKIQLDVFQIPIRLYNAKLHNNALGIGLKMHEIKLPQLFLSANGENPTDNGQINPSCIYSHLNIRGLGQGEGTIKRKFNAIPYLAYWDIYKQYYANKQEGIGAVIHNPMNELDNPITSFEALNSTGGTLYTISAYDGNADAVNVAVPSGMTILFENNDFVDENNVYLSLINQSTNTEERIKITDLFNFVTNNTDFAGQIDCGNINGGAWDRFVLNGGYWTKGYVLETPSIDDARPKITTFDLKNIDSMRDRILWQNSATQFLIDEGAEAPYNLPLTLGNIGKYPMQSNQEGLALKTYQSDLFNNWISTEWIEGSDGINALTSVDTSNGDFTINSLIIARKVYEMLNNIAVSGGSYDDWVNAVYSHERVRSIESPMYVGGQSRELAFDAVVSNASAKDGSIEQPLGTLAGRGVMTNKKKGGVIDIRVDEPSYIMGIISLTPRVDYSQGNKWDTNLQTMDDLHKPAMDEIGFQDLITDQMAYWDTHIDVSNQKTFRSAGKVPAWINYMTNVNVCRGNFADKNEQMFMTLNRNYERRADGTIKDLTTYVDPSKFNNIFADTRLDAQNFWAQISVDMKVRRKMSAKIMPNL